MARAGSIVCLGLLVLGLGASLSGAQAPVEVISLDDATFEHETQAATGQTTGIWCVLFTASKSSEAHKEAVELWRQLAADEDKEVIYAMVDLDVNKQLARRFKGLSVPSAVLLRDRGMYAYDIPNDDDSAEVIVGFVSGGYTQLPRQQVPSHSSGLSAASEPDGDKSSLTENDILRLKVAGVLLAVALVWKLALYLTAAKPPSAQAPVAAVVSKKVDKAVSSERAEEAAVSSANKSTENKQESKKAGEASAAKATGAQPGKGEGAKKKVAKKQ